MVAASDAAGPIVLTFAGVMCFVMSRGWWPFGSPYGRRRFEKGPWASIRPEWFVRLGWALLLAAVVWALVV